jgi:GntR family transcriptional regulator
LSRALSLADGLYRQMARKPRTAFRHETIAKQLIAEIREGVLPVGTQLPTEPQLCERFEASRHTVRQALRSLTDRKLIVRRAGSGSMIIASQEPRILVQSVGSMAKSLSNPSDLVREIVARDLIRVPSDLANFLQCDAGEEWFRLRTISSSKQSGRTESAAEVYVPAIYAGIVDHPQHETMRISDQVLGMYDEEIEKVAIEIISRSRPAEIAALLKAERDGGGFAIVRRYTGKLKRIFEVSVTYYLSGEHVFLMELRRQPSEGN